MFTMKRETFHVNPVILKEKRSLIYRYIQKRFMQLLGHSNAMFVLMTLKIKDHLTKHHKTVHLGQKRTSCKYCGKDFMTGYALQIHENAVHKGKKAHKCDQCEYKTFYKKDMFRHSYKHGEKTKEINCICGQEFVFETRLKRHLRTCKIALEILQ